MRYQPCWGELREGGPVIVFESWVRALENMEVGDDVIYVETPEKAGVCKTVYVGARSHGKVTEVDKERRRVSVNFVVPVN